MMAEAGYTVEIIGREKEPIVIIDDFYSDLAALIDYANSQSFSKNSPFYPGIRAPGNVNYLGEKMGLLTTILKEVFGVSQGARVVECNYSLVTTRPEILMPIQCLPHFDGLETGRIAVLHYLSRVETGGTAFYRHSRTGFETITADNFGAYKAALDEDTAEFGVPLKEYFNETTPQFEQLLNVEARPNRLILYRSSILHSGYIPIDFEFSEDPSLGRLTLNTFLQDKAFG